MRVTLLTYLRNETYLVLEEKYSTLGVYYMCTILIFSTDQSFRLVKDRKFNIYHIKDDKKYILFKKEWRELY